MSRKCIHSGSTIAFKRPCHGPPVTVADDVGGVPVVPCQHLAKCEDFQVLGDGQRLVLVGVFVLGRVIDASLKRRDRMAPATSFKESLSLWPAP
jgi:hypothetical protein